MKTSLITPNIRARFRALCKAAIAKGIVAPYDRRNYLARANRALRKNLAEPGDVGGDDLHLLIGLALAQAEIGMRPGWIPEVQKLGCEIADLPIPEEKPETLCTIQFEYTDAFGGEANYSWVEREELQLPASISDRALVRRAKAWAGLTGCRCTVSNYGDLIDIRPRGSCTVLFVSTVY